MLFNGDLLRLENNKRLEVLAKAERDLRSLADRIGFFRSHIDSFFAAYRSGNKIADDHECCVVLVRTQSGSHDVEEWRPGEPEKYTVEHIESLVLSSDLELDTTTNDGGLPGRVFLREKPGNGMPRLP